MLFYESDSLDPYRNLAVEEHLFCSLPAGRRCLMLWRNDRTIVVGKYQNTAEEINAAFVKERGIRVVRRLSGGGAVYHDKGNLNYTVIAPKEAHADFDFAFFAQPVIAALSRFGLAASLSGRNDITIDGKKISGNAQYIRQGKVLHHGCILLDSDLSDVADALRISEHKYSSRAVKSVRSRVTTINAQLPAPLSMETFQRVLTEELKKAHGEPEEVVFTDADLKEIKRLQDEKYATRQWNYGASPPYDVRKEMKFPAGLVTALMHVENDTIRDVRFYGDFFGDGEISLLEEKLRGAALDDTLAAYLETLAVERFLHGITAADLAELFLYG